MQDNRLRQQKLGNGFVIGGIIVFLFGLAIQLYAGEFAPTFWLWAILPAMAVIAGLILKRPR